MQQFVLSNPGFSLVVVLAMASVVVAALVLVRDVFLQRRHAIQHNYPVVGHLRYLAERIGPELRQYWVANDKEERPFNRSSRRWVYATAKGENNTFGFGTSEELYGNGYPILKHAAFPFPDDQAHVIEEDPTLVPCLKVLGAARGRRRPWRPMSVVNVSAMSFGSLGARATTAVNKGCATASAYHNTGEGGVAQYHHMGAELVWQLGTGYFGARTPDGRFDLEALVAKVERHPHIRAIEVKLSQGAKPGKGGILPAAKVTAEIAECRGIPVGKSCYSPNHHDAFGNVDEMIDFVERIAAATGLPVGIKSAVGQIRFWEELADRMKTRNEGPDYVQIDGGEGGTGAAPLAFADHVSLPFNIGFGRVYRVFQERGVAGSVAWIGSGKLGFPDRSVVSFAMGCDMIAVAREAMLAIGCIQAQKCHTGHCPTGIATHDRWLQGGLDVDVKADRLARYIQGFRKELLSLAYASGYEHPAQFTGDDVEFNTSVNRFETLAEVLGYRCEPVAFDGFGSLTRV
ncbi:MAG: FMN-binding glutamate synthase family protein [Myxococcales bacterium]|nr:FMN-binding glutamate synthase family protein [Myxococcales bacterium]